MVKKAIVIFLLLQIVSNNAFAEELIKLPDLFRHYNHHAQDHKDTKSFIDYLHNHYSDKQESNDDKGHDSKDDHSKLPFKHSANCLNSHSLVSGFLPSYLYTEMRSFHSKNSNIIVEDERIESLDLKTIWQPPKLV